MDLYPFLLRPVYQHYVWGGRRILEQFKRAAPPGVYAESWEVSDREEGESVVLNGPLAGQSLSGLLAGARESLLGDAVPGRFPLLIKLLDARETLSVQVHPDDEAAARVGGEAKTEMWYVLAAEPGACVYAGYGELVDEAVFRAAVAADRLEPLLRKVPVQAGDAVFMPGGRVHAIGAGCLMLEVQQNSNTTYRIYDWGRVGADGRARDLHIDAAVRVTRWRDDAPVLVVPERIAEQGRSEQWRVLACPYFSMRRVLLRDEWRETRDGRSFQVLFCAGGAARLSWPEGELVLSAGSSCLVPAALRSYCLQPVSGCSTVMQIESGRP
jgi:mannose-6-phosphate isomerase